MPWKVVLKELADTARANIDKVTKILPDNVTTKTNAVKTKNLRIDVHQSSKNASQAVARIQANAQADDNAVKTFIQSGNKGAGHKGTHKNVAEIPFDRNSFDVDDFTNQITNARK